MNEDQPIFVETNYGRVKVGEKFKKLFNRNQQLLSYGKKSKKHQAGLILHRDFVMAINTLAEAEFCSGGDLKETP